MAANNADVDILIAVRGAEQAQAQVKGVGQSISGLRAQGLQGISALRGLEGALLAMSGQGKIGAETVIHMTSLLPAFASAIGIGAIAVGGLALAGKKLVDEMNRVRAEELKRALATVDASVAASAAGWEAYFRAILDGFSRADAIAKKQAAESRKRSSDDASEIQSGIKRAHQEITRLELENERARLELEQLRLQERTFSGSVIPSMQREGDRFGRMADEVQSKIDANTRSIDQWREAIRGAEKGLEGAADHVKTLSDAESDLDEKTNAANKALEDQRIILEAIDRVRREVEDADRVLREVGDGVGKDFGGGLAFSFNILERKDSPATIARKQIQAEMDAMEVEFERFIALALDAEKAADLSFNRIALVAMDQIGNVGAGAFHAYADAIDAAIAGKDNAAEIFGRSVRNAVAQSVNAIGEEASVRGSMALAHALTALAFGDGKGAALHGAAAAKYFSIAAVAGAASGALSVSPGGSGGTRPVGAEPSGGRSGGTVHQSITIIGTLDRRDAEDLARQLREAEERRDLA